MESFGSDEQNEWWGLLGPEDLNSERRTRTLGLGASVRKFNDLAVPGLGGVWFGKQLFLATLGIAVAERARANGRRVQNIETANAIEALACWLALMSNGWKAEPRLRGAMKMHGKLELAFTTVRRPSFYVTQPMRMATVQALPALGLVEATAERFNSFGSNQRGHELIAEVCKPFNPCYYSKNVLEHLVDWVSGDNVNVQSSEKLQKALSPLEEIPEMAREILRECLVQGGGDDAKRRQAALDWVENIHLRPLDRVEWTSRPSPINESHWLDIRAGALFFEARDAAISLLDRLEAVVANEASQTLAIDGAGIAASKLIESLRAKSRQFLEIEHDPSPGGHARQFCQECTNSDPERLIEHLVQRDDRVLRMRDRNIVPGPAFRGMHSTVNAPTIHQVQDGAEPDMTKDISLPEGTSYRIRNLFLLNLDLSGKLGEWLAQQGSGVSQ